MMKIDEGDFIIPDLELPAFTFTFALPAFTFALPGFPPPRIPKKFLPCTLES